MSQERGEILENHPGLREVGDVADPRLDLREAAIEVLRIILLQLGHHAVDQIDPDMLIHLECVGCAEQHHAGEHVPLDLEPAV